MPNAISFQTSSKALSNALTDRPASRAIVRVGPRLQPAVRPGLLQGVNLILLRAVETLETWSARRQGRRALQGMPDHLLQDIGRSRADVEAEATKPFWTA